MKTQDAKKSPKIAIWAPSHNFVGYIFVTKARIDSRKKLVKQQYVLHMSPQYGELRPTSGWDRLTNLGHPCKFQLVSHLGSVTARHLLVGVSQTLRRWTEGATYIRQGDHRVGHWPTFLVSCIFVSEALSSSVASFSDNDLSLHEMAKVCVKWLTLTTYRIQTPEFFLTLCTKLGADLFMGLLDSCMKDVILWFLSV